MESGTLQRITKMPSKSSGECQTGGAIPLGMANTFVPFGLLLAGGLVSAVLAMSEFLVVRPSSRKNSLSEEEEKLLRCQRVLGHREVPSSAKLTAIREIILG